VTPSPPPLEPAGALADALARRDARAAVSAADAVAHGTPFLRASLALEKAVEAMPDEPGLAVRLLELLQSHGDWIRHDDLLGRSIARFPGRADLRFLAGRGYEARRLDCAAIRAYGHAARLDPEDVESVQRMATVFRARGRPFLARRRLRRSLRRHPEAAALHATMAYSYVDDGQFRKAVAAFERAVSLEPDDSPYLDDWGGALLLAERWREAAVVAVRSLKRRAQSEKGWTVFAVAHRHLGHRDKAEKGYRKAVEAARHPTRARGNLGLFLASGGADGASAAEAADHLRAALEAHPDWEEVRKSLESLGGWTGRFEAPDAG
jgi:Tfp pilus assembly protein PilF